MKSGNTWKEDEFRAPAVEYRPVPFWSWNGLLSRERLIGQIGRMHEAGVGGFFMHARNGLKTGYLDEDWFDCVRACIEEAERLGMKAWIYDEKGWPSGFAGGLVPSLGRDYRAKALVLLPERREDDEGCRLLEAFEAGGSASYLYEWVQPMGDPRFENAAYVDLLDPRVTEAFVQSTHRRYEERFGSRFGGTVPGVFSDEACALLWLDPQVPALPWTTGMDERFVAKYGYDLRPRLHELFLPEGDCRRVRYDYWSLVTELFAENFSRAVYEWCDERGLLYTGHLMAEDSLGYQMEWVGDVMRQYEYMHIPGLDHLGRYSQGNRPENNGEPYTTVLSAKQVSSVANQLGRERALSELFACAGQSFGMNRQKRMSDWHFIHGINLFSPHLLPYSLEGEGKRDYPPTIGPQQPWWGDYRLLTDYQARMSYALTRGRRVAPILVLHPMESAYECYSPLDRSQVDGMNAALEALSLRLLDAHLSFDYGNEHLLAKYGSVSAAGLRIQEAVYQAVVIPRCTRLRATTIRFLDRFAELGFPVLFDRDPEGGGLPEEARRLPLQPFSEECLRRQSPHSMVIEGEDAAALWLHEREDGPTRLYFLANMSGTKTVRVALRFEHPVRLTEWDAETGEARLLSPCLGGTGTELERQFEPRATLLLRAEPATGPIPGEGAVLLAGTMTEEALPLPPVAAPIPLHPNALVVDRFSRYDSIAGAWSEARYLAEWIAEDGSAPRGYRYRADIVISEALPQQELQVVVERQLAADVRWNGHPLQADGASWIDPDWLCYGVPADIAREGINEVEVWLDDRRYGGHMENLYVIGDFAVRLREGLEPAIGPPDGTVLDPSGDLSEQGYPFYAGSMEFSFMVDTEKLLPSRERPPGRWLLRLKRPRAGSISLRVDGVACGARAWAPWEWELPELQGSGSRRLALVMNGSLRNLVGPHHLQGDEEVAFLTPAHFFDRSRWTDRYVLSSFALGELELVYRRDGE
ncbi:glycosyl hydrolase [Cohnella fermenti]|uniref:Glycoside hydrolase n=1 Tax=Cohnella fermenti TaxID=2565925 RepID=A0A4S4BYQ1_9BACL|nr:glycosyl hydrolase [Cohnella fermenti]THF80291.1 hypothetical protein E6C55_10410 [Cohnella fermenti]